MFSVWLPWQCGLELRELHQKKSPRQSLWLKPGWMSWVIIFTQERHQTQRLQAVLEQDKHQDRDGWSEVEHSQPSVLSQRPPRWKLLIPPLWTLKSVSRPVSDFKHVDNLRWEVLLIIVALVSGESSVNSPLSLLKPSQFLKTQHKTDNSQRFVKTLLQN